MSRQVQRQERREQEAKDYRSDKASQGGGWVWILAIVVWVVSIGFSLVARFNDARAFEAVATPSLYCWLGLSLLCTIGVILMVRARRGGLPIPLYFRLALGAGVACGLLSVWLVALPVLTKRDAEAAVRIPGERLDLRNQTIQDRSFAGSNLRGSDFSGATLRHVDLSSTDLSESDLRNTHFEDVDLSGAKLCGVDLRHADLRGARGLESVADWSYVFYSPQRTVLPRSVGFILETYPGPIPDTGHDLLYMCAGDVTKRLKSGS